MNSYQLQQLITIMEQWYVRENNILQEIADHRAQEIDQLRQHCYSEHRRADMHRLAASAIQDRYNQLAAQHNQVGIILRMILNENIQIQRMYTNFVQVTDVGMVFNAEGNLSDNETDDGSSTSEDLMEDLFMEENMEENPVRRRLDFD